MGGVSRFFMLLSTPFPLLSPRPSAFGLVRGARVVSLASLAPSQSRRFSSACRPRLGFSVKASEQIHTQASVREGIGLSNNVARDSGFPHPWPEWTNFLESLRLGGYLDRAGSGADEEDAFALTETLPAEFAQVANACLAFAREQPELLRSLSRKDIEILVENGSAFLFRNGPDSSGRLRSFISSDGGDAWTMEARTVDVMRYLLSYACNHFITSYSNNYRNKELVETSTRNLLNELIGLIGATRQFGFGEPTPRQFSEGYGQPMRPVGQGIEMKRGDWICPKCSFMNFARNMKCRQCSDDRPKRVLTGGEWECPQCDFFNYGRNAVCIRCDSRRPGEPYSAAPSKPGLGFGREPNVVQPFRRSNSDQSDIERRLAENDEKAERWFSKVSQMDNVSDMSGAIADEDFPEIMPLRKGVNKFVVSTRKTPLERRLANAQYLRNLGNDGSPEGNEKVDGNGSSATSRSSISESLDRILGTSLAASGSDKGVSEWSNKSMAAGEDSTGSGSSPSLSYSRSSGNQGKNSAYVPFVPLPADLFTDSQKSKTENQMPNSESSAVEQIDSKKIDDQSERSERWFKKVQELDGVTDLANAISDEDFPEIMPMRKGENRFVVPRKKDRSLTSPQYKRRLAMEQANNSNFVPFVPFPPDYFAKKDKLPDGTASVSSAPENSAEISGTPPENKNSSLISGGLSASGEGSRDNRASVHDLEAPGSRTQQYESWQDNRASWNVVNHGKAPNSTGQDRTSEVSSRYSMDQSSSLRGSGSLSGNSSQHAGNSAESKTQGSNSGGFTGKSLEGSAVTEPDPLDMSEEAKAQRWFKRVAQIKDISELSQIPDEDFPSIMPMRKGVNRFVVSKRKTPLERRLTSQQYRRNLPIVSSDPGSTPSSEKDSS